MPGFENLPYRSAEDAEAPYDTEEEREYAFRSIILAKLLRTTEQSLEDAEFSPEEIREFMAAVATLDETDQLTVLSLPHELRERLYRTHHEEIEKGNTSVERMVEKLLSANKKFGFSIGYHLSDHRIPKTQAWSVSGKELDDRDNALMAYYSEDYLHRYKKKPARYLYAVRAETGPTSSHKRDTSNRWSRAPQLSIVDEYDMREIEHEIDEKIKENAAAQRDAA